MNQHPFWWSSFSSGETVTYYINVNPNSLTFTFESGLTSGFTVTTNTGFTVTTGASWFTTDITGGTSGTTIVNVTMVTSNTGLTNRSGMITVENSGLGITKTVTIIQEFESQPILFIMTEGGSFVGDLTP